ncbi:MAG: M48 family metallopeptidase, partial [Cyanobacteria bacterium J06641_5]
MSGIYPEGPISVPGNLSKPRNAYRQRAILATIGVVLFVGFYLALSGWFVWTTYRLLSNGRDIFWGILSGFTAIFLLKALFRIEHNSQPDSIEISSQDEPKLFAFLYRLADEAQAPRPHRVFLSPRVNARVFYNVSALNLFFPAKKNLDIGLGLVNILSLGEIKAVLAHEFGHFGQHSMAMGQWVCLAQQIAAHILTERDALHRL